MAPERYGPRGPLRHSFWEALEFSSTHPPDAPLDAQEEKPHTSIATSSSDERPEEMDTGALPEQNDHTLSQDVLIGEEGLSEEEKARRKAERRKAKRKRQRQRKKLERGKKDESTEQEEEEEEEDNAGVDSELDESEESEPEEVEDIDLLKVEEKPVAPPSKCPSGPPLASGNKSNRQPTARPSEEDPGWDVNSAFVANAVSHIRPKAKSKGAHKSKENKENESRMGEPLSNKSFFLFTPEKGIRFVQEGQYTQAVSLFTEAIKCDPKDYRFFGNRSYCYCCLEQYPLALADAEKSIQMAPDWPKGYYRKGSALMGLKEWTPRKFTPRSDCVKPREMADNPRTTPQTLQASRYSEAEKAMDQVLKLDQDCEEAVNDLLYCKVQQLMDFGYDEEQSIQLLEKYNTVQAVVAAKASNQDCALLQPGPCNSLWVGNVTTELTEKHLRDLFKIYGEIDSIRVLHERFCAFVNFKNANMASRAMEKLNIDGFRESYQHLPFNNLPGLLGQDAEVRSTAMSVTSGGPPAVILEIDVAISTFLIIEAKTGNPESTLASLFVSPKNSGRRLHDCQDQYCGSESYDGSLEVRVLRRQTPNLTGFQSRRDSGKSVSFEVRFGWCRVPEHRCTASPSAEVYTASHIVRCLLSSCANSTNPKEEP
ncbi:Tetratricopeptide repeat protein 31 [Labeo rohita]|uniref:Tetratricopeptide repeat protein 31 n=1 Tax=Labeo rohita TaxID=84645 RepID=A0ABQ8M553_LABRO|nr:Tetratricopeptide repeat protein 31 [Labeo rohita]